MPKFYFEGRDGPFFDYHLTLTPLIQAVERSGDEFGLGVRRGIPTLSLREGRHYHHHIVKFHI